jgi:hypothetical protein
VALLKRSRDRWRGLSPRQALAKGCPRMSCFATRHLDTWPVRTHTVLINGYTMNITLSADEKIIERARKAA